MIETENDEKFLLAERKWKSWIKTGVEGDYENAGPDIAERLKKALGPVGKDPETVCIDGFFFKIPYALLHEKAGYPTGLPTNLLFQKSPPLVLNPYRNYFVKRIKKEHGIYHHVLEFDPPHQLVKDPFEFSKYVSVGPVKCPPRTSNMFENLYINCKAPYNPEGKPEPLYITFLDVPLIGSAQVGVPRNGKWEHVKSKYMHAHSHPKSGKTQIRLGMGGEENQLKEVTLIFQTFVENQFRWLWRAQTDIHVKLLPFCQPDPYMEKNELSDLLIFGAEQIQPIVKVNMNTNCTYAVDNAQTEADSKLTATIWNNMCETCTGTVDVTVRVQAWCQHTDETIEIEGVEKRVVKVGLTFTMAHVNYHPINDQWRLFK